LPFTADETGRLRRGDNATLMAERLDVEPASADEELTVQVTTRDREHFGLRSMSEDTSGSAVVLISGARLSPLMSAQQEFAAAAEREARAAEDRVEAYLERHDVPRREELEDGRIR
ncbi:hypothetical protein, partial [Chitinivibrio alkaliphilus]|uniref:hypothetical protein n=1 Tax=Chitinivibrio alkaliphilus TaxID=1505232 RepID=UPI00054FB6DA